MTDSICKRTGCNRRATHYCVIRVPAIGNPLGPTVGLIMDVDLCRDHAETIEPSAFLTAEGKATILKTLEQQRRAEPDFDRARIDVRRVGDARWNDLRSAKREVN